jgi:copper transport protein
MRNYKLWVFIGFMLILMFPGRVDAHANLLRAVPEPNMQHPNSPEKIELTFNERIEDSLYSIKVLNSDGRSAVVEKAKMNADQTGIYLEVPQPLSNGNYVVTYHVISSDGHPVSGSYVLMIGFQTPAVASDAVQHQHEVSLRTLDASQSFQFLARIVYYIAMLSLVGWILWIRLLGTIIKDRQDRLSGWTLAWQRIFLLALLFLIFTHFRELLGDSGFGGLLQLFTGTRIGLSWIISLALAGLSFYVLQRSKWLDIIWVITLIGAKCLNGHAIGFQPTSVLVLLNAIHLLAASLWAGGLWMLLAFRKDRAVLDELAPRFSRMAFWSLIILTITGVLTTVLYLPNLSYVWYSQWGNFLLIKSLIVLCVVVLAIFIRYVMKRKGVERVGRLVKVDISLMLIIAGLVGLLTYLAPVPANQPLNWHVMGETRHLTVRITPNVPGVNKFIVKAWLDEKLGKPKKVQLILIPNDSKEMAPIEVPIQPFDDPELDIDFGSKRFSFISEGPYLPFAGSWTVQVRIMDTNDDETVYHYPMRIFE